LARPRFIVVYQGRRIPLPDGDFVVGRGIGCHIRFNAETVSRQHLRLTVEGGRVRAVNLSRTTGTTLNGSKLIGERSLTHGDELGLGPRKFKIEVEDVDHADLAALDRASEHDGDEEPTGVRMPDEPARPPSLPRHAHAEFDFHTCPQCLARVAFGDSTCVRCGYVWSATHPSAVTGRATLRDIVGDAAPIPAEVPVVYGSDELTIDAVVSELRRDGAFIPSQLLDAPGTPCELTLLPDGLFAMKVKGKVTMVRTVADAQGAAGMDVRFETVTSLASAWLDRWLAARSGE